MMQVGRIRLKAYSIGQTSTGEREVIDTKEWEVYALVAAIAYGLSAIPLKIAAAHSVRQGLAEALLLITSVSSLVGASIYVLTSGRLPVLVSTFDEPLFLYGGLAGLISIIGSISVIKALGLPSSSISNVMALVNTNVFFTILFSTVFIGRLDGATMIKTIIGSTLIFAGAVMICI